MSKVSPHDWLIDRLASTNGFSTFAGENAYEIAKNPDGEKNRCVKLGDETMWPDVFVFNPKDSTVKRIGEVETEETVTKEHAEGHWDLYSKAAAGDFVLAIPNDSLDAAKGIVKQLQVKCKIWVYVIKTDSNGNPSSVEFKSMAT